MITLSKEKIYQLVEECKNSPEGKVLVIFGAGKLGHEAIAYCVQEGIKISYITDNNAGLWGNKIEGIEIIPPQRTPDLKPDLIILASDHSREMATQLETYGLNQYISYFLFKFRYSMQNVPQPGTTSVERACNWILNNQKENGGVSVFCGSSYEYPEVTGYIIPTMLRYGFRDEALNMAQYLASVANQDGSFNAAGSDRVYLFDTAQALRGLNAICEVTDQYIAPRKKTAEYLFSVLKEHGGIFPKSYQDDPIVPETIMLFALPPMLEYARMTGDVDQVELIHQAVQQYLQEPEVLSMRSLTHFLAYQIDGLIDLGYRKEVRPVIDQLLNSQREDGSIPAWKGADWVCITGCSQIAICLYKLEMPEPANKLMAWVEQNIEDDGGFLGSVGPRAEYYPDRELSWAVKFYLDAYKWMIRAHFNYEFAPVSPEEIAEDDGEVLAVIKELEGREHILEVGCGKGRILKQIHKRFPGCKLEGVDISTGMLSYVPDYVKTQEGDVEFLPYEDGLFDLVYTVECIEHSVNLRAAVRELVRVCKPGGKIIVIDKQLSNWGRFTTPPWERWPNRMELETVLKEHCTSVISQPVQPHGYDVRDEMFVEWKGIKRLPLENYTRFAP